MMTLVMLALYVKTLLLLHQVSYSKLLLALILMYMHLERYCMNHIRNRKLLSMQSFPLIQDVSGFHQVLLLKQHMLLKQHILITAQLIRSVKGMSIAIAPPLQKVDAIKHRLAAQIMIQLQGNVRHNQSARYLHHIIHRLLHHHPHHSLHLLAIMVVE